MRSFKYNQSSIKPLTVDTFAEMTGLIPNTVTVVLFAYTERVANPGPLKDHSTSIAFGENIYFNTVVPTLIT